MMSLQFLEWVSRFSSYTKESCARNENFVASIKVTCQLQSFQMQQFNARYAKTKFFHIAFTAIFWPPRQASVGISASMGSFDSTYFILQKNGGNVYFVYLWISSCIYESPIQSYLSCFNSLHTAQTVQQFGVKLLLESDFLSQKFTFPFPTQDPLFTSFFWRFPPYHTYTSSSADAKLQCKLICWQTSSEAVFFS